jgi:hypothetical protein
MKRSFGFLILCSFVFLFLAQPALAWKQKEDECLGCVSGWTAIDTPYGGKNIFALAMRSPSLIIAENDSGVYRANFVNIYSTFAWRLLTRIRVTSVVIHVDSLTADTIIYVGTNGSGLLKIKTYPLSIRSPANGAKGVSLTSLLFAWPASVGPAPYSLLIASDSGYNNWIFTTNTNNTNFLFTYNTLLPLTTYYWRVEGYGPGGGTWSPSWSFTTACSTCTGTTLGQPDNVIISGTGLVDKYVRALASDSKGSLYAISSSSVAGVFTVSRSGDSGKTWTSLGRPLPAAPVTMTSIAIDSRDNIFTGTDNGIFRYNGGAWDSISTSLLPDKHINALAADDNNHLFAGTDHGAFFSTDLGVTWAVLGGSGLPAKITALAAGSPGPMTPLVGTGTGLFEYIASTPDIKQTKHSSMEFPTGRSLRFTTTGVSQLVDLRVYDSRGAEKMRLMHGELAPGTHEIGLDKTRFHSGVYYIQLKTGQVVETRVMVITR